MSPGSLAWRLRLPGLIMVGLVPALCVPGSVLTTSRPSVLGSGVIPLPLSRSTFLFVLVPKWLEPLIGLAQHNVREGWRAWVWKKYSQCGRHEVQSLPVSDQTFPSLDIKNTRSWILSSPVAATVGLGATFSPGTYSRIPSSSRSSACPWGCGGVGFWEHITWECPYRLGPFPPKPSWSFSS